MLDRVRAKTEAKAFVKARWGSCVGATLLAAVIGLIPIVGTSTGQLGSCHFYLDATDRRMPTAGRVGDGFNNLGKAFLLALWQALWLFIWSLPGEAVIGLGALLGPVGMIIGYIIGGIYLCVIMIIKNIQYGYAHFALADNPNAGVRDCLNRSKQITSGNIGGLFVVQLSFILWHILAGFTFGLLYLLWLLPYINATQGNVYRQLTGGARAGAAPQYAGGPAPYNAAPQQPPRQNAAPQFGFIGTNGALAGYTFPLRAGETLTIGSNGQAAQIVISVNSGRVSPRHCSISFDMQAGLYIVTDVSEAGTYLTDGTRLPPQQPCRVARGTILCLGDGVNSIRLI